MRYELSVYISLFQIYWGTSVPKISRIGWSLPKISQK